MRKAEAVFAFAFRKVAVQVFLQQAPVHVRVMRVDFGRFAQIVDQPLLQLRDRP